MKKNLIFVAFILIAASQCTKPVAYNHNILHILPEQEQLKEWKPVEPAQTFVGKELYSYMNGGAEIYYSNGFKQLVAQEYSKGKNKTISLEIFEMKDKSGAQAMFSLKTGKEGIPLRIGNEALLEEYYVNFRKNNFLVTLTAYKPDKESLNALVEIAADVDQNMKD
jgi:hypothetical protein